MQKQTSARVAGALFVAATASGVVGAVLLGPLDTLSTAQSIADNAQKITAGALLVLIMGVAIALIPPTLFPVLKQHGEAHALGYVATRLLEVVLFVPAVAAPLMLVAISTDHPAHLDTVRVLSQTQEVWTYSVSSVFFCVSVVLLNFLLYRSKLVPRWISGWALVAVVLYLADAVLVMFGEITVTSPIHHFLYVPLALNEMVLAIWLLTKGFRSTLDTPIAG